MKVFIIVLLALSSFLSFAKTEEIIVTGKKATAIIKNFTYGEHFKPAYHHQSEIYCKAKAIKSRSWAYASCSNLAWFDNGSKSAYLFTMALINALPQKLQKKLTLSNEEIKNKYTMGITIESLICTKGEQSSLNVCEIAIDLNNQDRSGINF